MTETAKGQETKDGDSGKEHVDGPLVNLRRRFTQGFKKDESADKAQSNEKEDNKETSPEQRQAQHEQTRPSGDGSKPKDDEAGAASSALPRTPLVKRVQSLASGLKNIFDHDKDKESKQEPNHKASVSEGQPQCGCTSMTEAPALDASEAATTTPACSPPAKNRISLSAVGAEARQFLFGSSAAHDDGRQAKQNASAATTMTDNEPSKCSPNEIAQVETAMVPVLESKGGEKAQVGSQQKAEEGGGPTAKKESGEWKAAVKKALATPLHFALPSHGENAATEKKKEPIRTAHLEEGREQAAASPGSNETPSSPPRSPLKSPVLLFDHLKSRLQKVASEKTSDESSKDASVSGQEKAVAQPSSSTEVASAAPAPPEKEEPKGSMERAGNSLSKKEEKSTHRLSILSNIKKTLSAVSPLKTSDNTIHAPENVATSASSPVTLPPEAISSPSEQRESTRSPEAPLHPLTIDTAVDSKKKQEDVTPVKNTEEDQKASAAAVKKEDESEADDSIFFADLPPTPTPKAKSSSTSIMTGKSIAVTAREE